MCVCVGGVIIGVIGSRLFCIVLLLTCVCVLFLFMKPNPTLFFVGKKSLHILPPLFIQDARAFKGALRSIRHDIIVENSKSALVIMVFAWWCVVACHPRVFVVSLEEEEEEETSSSSTDDVIRHRSSFVIGRARPGE